MVGKSGASGNMSRDCGYQKKGTKTTNTKERKGSVNKKKKRNQRKRKTSRAAEQRLQKALQSTVDNFCFSKLFFFSFPVLLTFFSSSFQII